MSYGAYGTAVTMIAALGGVLGIIYYLRPMPDLLASTTTQEARSGLASALWVIVVLALGIVPSAAWFIAK